ncbi:MAG: hypothetical protein WD773_10855 [Gemmatimonadales bacterium]
MMRACLAVAVSAALVLTACRDRGAGDRVTLRYHPPAGAVYHYTLVQRNLMTMESGPLAGMGQQEIGMRMHFTQTVTGPAAGGSGIEVQVTFDSTSMEVPGVPADTIARVLSRLRGLKSTVVFDERGQVLRTDLGPTPGVPPEVAAQMAGGIKAMTFAFPAQPVGKGDSWTISTELPVSQLPGVGGGAGPARTTLTVRDIRVAGADTTVVFDITTMFPTDPIPLDIAGQRASLKLSGTLTGDQQFSLARGAVLEGTLKGTMKMNVTAAALGTQEMVVSSDMENTLRLVDAK